MKDGEKTRRDNHSFLTKKGLERARERGVKLGCPQNLTNDSRLKSIQVRKEKARTNKANIQAAELSRLYKTNGHTLQQIADKLNNQGYKTSRGNEFKPTTIKRLLERALSE